MTHVPLSIRSAKRDDIPAIVDYANSSTSEKEEAGFERPFSQRTFNDVKRLSAVWRDPNVVGSEVAGEEGIVAETEDRVVGYVTMENVERACFSAWLARRGARVVDVDAQATAPYDHVPAAGYRRDAGRRAGVEAG